MTTESRAREIADKLWKCVEGNSVGEFWWDRAKVLAILTAAISEPSQREKESERIEELPSPAGNIWFCKIGDAHPIEQHADWPMRKAIRKAFLDVTGQEPRFIFSGWGGTLTESEWAVANDTVQEMLDKRAAAQKAEVKPVGGSTA